jgi:putative copper export protein/mono/diheme cytochrome c family protein
MEAAFIVVRAVHFAGCIWLVGELAFASFVLPPAWRTSAARGDLVRHLARVGGFACAAALLSGIGWLWIQAANMSGTPIDRVSRATLAVVLRDTSFGQVFALRALAFVTLVASLVALATTRNDRRRAALLRIALVVAAIELVALVFVGHAAAAGGGLVGDAHLVADALHLAAAGAWLGALPPLVLHLAPDGSSAALSRIARRFSVLGITCVVVLIVTGVVNTLLLVGSVPALFGTSYGRWLLLKLAMFAVMIGLAGVNKLRWTPRVAEGDANAVRALRRNAVLEAIGGGVIIAIVGALGTMIPGAHEPPRWPFPFTLQPGVGDMDMTSIAIVSTSTFVAVVGISLVIAGMRRHWLPLSISGALALALSALASTSLFAVPAYPTTYASSPVPYTVDAVARGAADYAEHCARCHGPAAHGDGPDARTLAIKPKNLAEHALHHRPGNIFWWIAHGIPRSPMPGFSPELSNLRIWQIVQYVIARASAEAATGIGPRVDTSSMSRTPDFTYETPGRGQQTLRDRTSAALLVLFTRGSRHRLAELVNDHRLMHAGLRVVAVPLDDSAPGEGGQLPMHVDADVAKIYAMYAMKRDGARATHAELLVDRGGTLRARWLGLPDAGSDRDAQIADALRRLPAAAPTGETHHGH